MWGFTRQEQRAVIFLLITFFIGCGILFYRKQLDPPSFNNSNATTFETFLKFLQKNSEKSQIDSIQLTHSTTNQKININRATYDQLKTLPGIGPVVSKRIIEYRTHTGLFQNVNDLTKIKGIGKKKIDAILEKIVVQ